MKEKNVEVCIRMNPTEKKKLQRNAKKCGLNLSAYLRKTGLKQEIYSIPDKEFYKIYIQISELKNKIFGKSLDNKTLEEITLELEKIKTNFLNIYNSKKVEDYDGDD